MTQKRKTEVAERPQLPDLWRLAEVVQARRVTVHTPGGSSWYLECQLCLGRSSLEGQITHTDVCPVERMKQ